MIFIKIYQKILNLIYDAYKCNYLKFIKIKNNYKKYLTIINKYL